jgi:protein involved in polysaccharide export with SLBB domain
MKLRKAIIVFFLILSFEGTGFAQLAQVGSTEPVSGGMAPAQAAGVQPGMQSGQRLPSQQVQSPGVQGTSLPALSPPKPGQQSGAEQPDQPKPGSTPTKPSQIPTGENLSEFEQFIASGTSGAISTNIGQFGYDLFRQPPSTFAPSDRVPVGPDYVLGPGDELRITIWGNIEGQWNVSVDRDGKITLPKVGIMGVTGLTFGEFKETLNKELSKYYTNFQMNVSMGPLRTIRVYIVGNAARPGAYTVSSLSTLVNSLFEAGGPSKTGTMRNIDVKRNGKTVIRFDMYDFLLKGDKTKDVRLMPEDVIFIPPV